MVWHNTQSEHGHTSMHSGNLDYSEMVASSSITMATATVDTKHTIMRDFTINSRSWCVFFAAGVYSLQLVCVLCSGRNSVIQDKPTALSSPKLWPYTVAITVVLTTSHSPITEIPTWSGTIGVWRSAAVGTGLLKAFPDPPASSHYRNPCTG